MINRQIRFEKKENKSESHCIKYKLICDVNYKFKGTVHPCPINSAASINNISIGGALPKSFFFAEHYSKSRTFFE